MAEGWEASQQFSNSAKKVEKQNKMGITWFGRTQNTNLQKHFFFLQATLDTNTNQWQKENDPKNAYTLPTQEITAASSATD